MIKKTVDNSGAIVLRDGDAVIATIETKLERESKSFSMRLSGNFRTDTQVYLDTELQLYDAFGMSSLEIDCADVNAISPGCFRVLLDYKIKMNRRGASFTIFNKPKAILSLEKITGKQL